jgi:Skp family chaperone for outer membrane proteins
VVLALKEARIAWRDLKTEFETKGRNEVAAKRRSVQSIQDEAREFKREAQRQRQELKNDIKDAVKRVHKPNR